MKFLVILVTETVKVAKKTRIRVQDDWACEAVRSRCHHFAVLYVMSQVSTAQSIPDMHYRDRVRARELAMQVKFSLHKARSVECLEHLQCDA